MSVNYEIEVFSHKSIYNNLSNNNLSDRKLKTYFSVPNDVNEDTGLLLIISGFGGHANSNVYKKMRDEFADNHNLVTLQCDYFGYEFMQSASNIILPNISKEKLDDLFKSNEVKEIFNNGEFNFNKFIEIGSKYNINVEALADLSKENKNNFNDMGILQAIDNIIAVLNVMNILYDNNYCFNSKKIIIYGHSHGAYLAYLCNAFAPKLFSLIIDNSAWLLPSYLKSDRFLIIKIGRLTVTTIFQYLAKKIIKDEEILNLVFLYSKFRNKASIISFHGTTDNLINCSDKYNFCKNIPNCIYNEVSQDRVDNLIFRSTNHGLDADFIKLFEFTMTNFNIGFEKSNSFDLQDEIIYQTNNHKYIINYENVIPSVTLL